jgi:hypothetical protein
MAHPLGDTHPAQLLPGQANRVQDTVLPLPGHLVGKRRIDQVHNAKQEDQPGKSLQDCYGPIPAPERKSTIQTELAIQSRNICGFTR